MSDRAYKKTVAEVEKRANDKIELQELKNRKGKLLQERRSFEASNRELKNAFNGRESAFERTKTIVDGRLLEEAKNRLSASGKHLKDKVKEIVDIDSKINKLAGQIVDKKSSTGHEAIIQHQENIAEIQKEYDGISTLIAAQKQTISDSALVDGTAELRENLEECLTCLAMGEGNQADVDKIELEIDKQEASDTKANLKHNKVIKNAQNTINGLNKKLNEVNDRLRETNSLSPLLMDDYLQSLALETAAEYEKAAYKVYQSINKLKALDALIERTGVKVNSGLFPQDRWEIHLPLMGSMETIQAVNAERCYMGINNITHVLEAATEEVKKIIKNKGINL